MPEDDTLIILAGLGVIAWLILNKAATPTGTAAVTPTTGYQDGNCPGCTPGSTPSGPVNSMQQAKPNIGSWQNDAVLQELTRMIDASNAAGNWDQSWALAAKRDAWIKTQGY